MSEMTADGAGASMSRANLALGASLLAFALWVVAGAVNEDLYTLLPIPAAAGVVLGLRARRDGGGARRALAAIVVGGVLATAWLVFFVAFLAGWADS
jgi:hypothetical protein